VVSVEVTNSDAPNTTGKMVVYGRGNFIKWEDFLCEPECKPATSILDRPDYATDVNVVKEFTWIPDSRSCTDKQMPKTAFNPYSFYEEWYEVRTPATFRGRTCYAYYNTTLPNTCVYGNHETGELLGGRSDKILYVVTVTAGQFSRKDFTMDRDFQSQCSEDSYALPDEEIYTNACKDIPTETMNIKDFKSFKKFW